MTVKSPHALWKDAGGDPEKYRALMVEHGHIVDRCRAGKHPDRPSWDAYDLDRVNYKQCALPAGHGGAHRLTTKEL